MLGSTTILLAAVLLTKSLVDGKFSVSHPIASRAALPLTVSSHVLTLTRTNSGKGYNSRSAAAVLGLAKIPTSKHIAALAALDGGGEFATEITFGKETFLALVDTGSSDTWIVEKGFQCLSLGDASEPEAACNFGPTYTISKTFVQTPDENFNITYEDAEYLNGIIGTEDVTFAGLKLKQTVAIIDYAAWVGDGVSSGLIGLAYPDL
jgi:aspergillopepsin I